jgi:hypothetical protein
MLSSGQVRQERAQLLLPPAVRMRPRVLHVPQALPAVPHLQGRLQEDAAPDAPGVDFMNLNFGPKKFGKMFTLCRLCMDKEIFIYQLCSDSN